MYFKSCLVLSQYREGSNYKDLVGTHYHFPKTYHGLITSEPAHFIYYEPAKRGRGEYFGYGEIGQVTKDPDHPDQYFAEIINFRPFPNPVSASDPVDGTREPDLSFTGQRAVRKIDEAIFNSICEEGGIDISTLGVDLEFAETDENIINPFDPSKIKVDRDNQSIFQVLRKLHLGEIILTPDFQRNMVWDPVRRSRLIESVILRIPLPAFYFDGVDSNKWAVIDGLQRLSTLSDFISKKSFRLTGLEYLTPVNGHTFDELPRGMQRDLEETQITLFIIRPDTPPEVKFTIFYRINTGGLVLTPQEIRHALFQGPATGLLKKLAGSTEFLHATESGVSDTRMDARECILRCLAFRLENYANYSKPDLNSFLSSAMRRINEMIEQDRARLRDSFLEGMTRATKVLGRYAFRKFSLDSNRRGPINKALFESWSNALQDYPLSDLLAKKNALISSLAHSFENDAEYTRSLSAGTGGIRAVKERFGRAHQIIQGALK